MRCEPRTSKMWHRSASHHTITFALAPTSALCLKYFPLKSLFHDPQMWKLLSKSSGLKGQTECSQSQWKVVEETMRLIEQSAYLSSVFVSRCKGQRKHSDIMKVKCATGITQALYYCDKFLNQSGDYVMKQKVRSLSSLKLYLRTTHPQIWLIEQPLYKCCSW
jgi:hypothetical protein